MRKSVKTAHDAIVVYRQSSDLLSMFYTTTTR